MEHTKDNLYIWAELDRMRDYLSKSSRPVFFIGSGISRRYLGLPDWSGLLEGIAQEVGADFAEMSGKYDFERLAGELEYFYFRSQPWERVSGCPRRRLMREAIARRIETMSQTNACPVPGAAPGRELQELRHTVPRAVITTNYDTFAETMFPDSRVHIGRETSAGWEEDDRIDIYKIHGCVTAPDSIVITKEDYDEFFEKSRYLYAKILTLFCECPLIFMGYSLNDRNIKDVLTAIVEALPPEEAEKFREHVWVLGWSREAGDERVCKKEIGLLNGSSLEAVCFELHDYTEFFRAVRSVTENRRRGDLKFSISEDVIELLIKPLYGRQDSLKVAVRELLQNALDACRMKGGGPGAEIAVLLEEGEEGLFLEIRDNGIGMGAEDIRANFLTVGKTNKKGTGLGTVGKYGIGVLSVFLAGEYAEVYTQKEGSLPLAFRLYIKEDNQKHVSWMDSGGGGRFEGGSGTAVRVCLGRAQRDQIAGRASRDSLLQLLGLNTYLTEEGTRITVTEAASDFCDCLPSLPPDEWFYKVDDEIRIYRARWRAGGAAAEAGASPAGTAICARDNTVFFSGMTSPASFHWGRYTMLQKIPFIALNISNLDMREDDFSVSLSRDSVTLSGVITEGIAHGIYDMETDKVTDLVKSWSDSLRGGSAGAEGLKNMLQRECTVFGSCDILMELPGEENGRERLLAAGRNGFTHLELWGGRGWRERILHSPNGLPVKLCGAYMRKKDLADLIEDGKLIAVSVCYLDDYLYNATGPSNGLRAKAVKQILEVLGIPNPWNLTTSEILWAFIRKWRDTLRVMYTEKSDKGILWLREEYKNPYEDSFEGERILVFLSYGLENPADPAFCRMLQEKIEGQGLGDLLSVQE